MTSEPGARERAGSHYPAEPTSTERTAQLTNGPWAVGATDAPPVWAVVSVLMVMASIMFVGKMHESIHVWRQPTLAGHVTGVRLTGGSVQNSREVACSEARIDVAVSDGSSGYFTACGSRFAPGEALKVRRERRDPAVLYPNPMPALDRAWAAFGVLATAAGLSLGWLVVQLSVSWRRYRRTGELPGAGTR